jgi:hypothetical protein
VVSAYGGRAARAKRRACAHTTWRPKSSGPVQQKPSRKKPVFGDRQHSCSVPPRTFRSALGITAGAANARAKRSRALSSPPPAPAAQRVRVARLRGATRTVRADSCANATRIKVERSGVVCWAQPAWGGTSDSHPTFRRHKRRAPGPTSPRGAL